MGEGCEDRNIQSKLRELRHAHPVIVRIRDLTIIDDDHVDVTIERAYLVRGFDRDILDDRSK